MKELKIEKNAIISDIFLGGKPLRKVEVAFESNNGVYRLYIDRNKEEEIFDFVAIRQTTAFDDWNNDKVQGDILFYGRGIFDGVRHLILSDYMDHVSMDALAKMFTKVREIEVEICSLAD